jgi:hypothetical protein
MVLAIMWVVVVVALLALMVAWGGTIDDASAAHTRTPRAMPRVRRGRRGVASPTAR